MKALDVLNNIRNDIELILDTNSDSYLFQQLVDIEQAILEVKDMITNLEFQDIMIADYKKRIDELEAPKSCDTCKHQNAKHDSYEYGCMCLFCIVSNDKYADYYEPNKDKQ